MERKRGNREEDEGMEMKMRGQRGKGGNEEEDEGMGKEVTAQRRVMRLKGKQQRS